MKLYTLFCALVITGAVQAEMYKCTVDGSIVYSQVPCAPGSKKVKIWDSNVGSYSGSVISSNDVDAMSPQSAASKLAGIAGNAETMARECEIDLRLNSSNISSCEKFLDYIKGASWQSGTKIADHLQATSPDYSDMNMRRAERSMQTVSRVIDTISTR